MLMRVWNTRYIHSMLWLLYNALGQASSSTTAPATAAVDDASYRQFATVHMKCNVYSQVIFTSGVFVFAPTNMVCACACVWVVRHLCEFIYAYNMCRWHGQRARHTGSPLSRFARVAVELTNKLKLNEKHCQTKQNTSKKTTPRQKR